MAGDEEDGLYKEADGPGWPVMRGLLVHRNLVRAIWAMKLEL